MGHSGMAQLWHWRVLLGWWAGLPGASVLSQSPLQAPELGMWWVQREGH